MEFSGGCGLWFQAAEKIAIFAMVMTGKGRLRPSYVGNETYQTRLTKSDFIGFCRGKTDQVSYQVIPETPLSICVREGDKLSPLQIHLP